MSNPKRTPLRRGDVLTVVLDDQLIEALDRMRRWKEGERCYEGNATQWTFDDKDVVDALLDVYRAEKRASESQ